MKAQENQRKAWHQPKKVTLGNEKLAFNATLNTRKMNIQIIFYYLVRLLKSMIFSSNVKMKLSKVENSVNGKKITLNNFTINC